MRRAALLLLIAASFYLAAMYRYPLLLALCAVELLLLPLSLCLAQYFRKRLSASFLQQCVPVEVGSAALCHVQTSYTGRLPVSRFAVCLRGGYPSQRRRVRETLRGGTLTGETRLEFCLLAPYCGLLELRLARIKVYDYLLLFAARKRQRESMSLAVFPKEQALQVLRAAFPSDDAGTPEEQSVLQAGSAQEIRQLREYRAGDPVRHIHWKLTAKTDILWRKEYERETDAETQLYLDLTAKKRMDIAAMSRFYTLAAALISGLLQSAASVRVSWYDGRLLSVQVADAAQCREMLLRLYRAKPLRKAPPVNLPAEAECFRLTTSLGWYRGAEQLFQFNEKRLGAELREVVFYI